ncbi:UDP-N-acetylglucosamine 1-carboxyvinyltransferase [Candidatus Gottesmanbacteria bacterium RIFCSPLOWO2_01_FULL_46_9]|uniref:UDP-N-acetylglucosamine 1-carboxyvinyltransferase n=1 Tax=Candidatus Gottesmanbacteria bacterium RIFCSPLOWO2_01_FULL_46_9 TaxID=1798394 RepID=A0A1F6B3X1_9BACT|nr:MAG: UDP-N-acetylglucosamine 1-carboxyvinyltransferase [Candidatus Gottesmanbacteria bacterium RIFCSPLOWO2_01_FULL_46_9]
MDKFIVTGGTPLHGEITVGGAKNVALKVLVAALLTDEELIIHNLPLLRDVFFMLEVLESLGVVHRLNGHTLVIQNKGTKHPTVPLEVGARLRTSSMVIGPLLARFGKAKIPNPGGCRLGARPIDRHIEALKRMGAEIKYSSDDGYFYGHAHDGLHGATIEFSKNTHTGTETLILAAVLARGTTILKNAAEEIEIDELIGLLNAMGGKIKRTKKREITIEGVSRLGGTEYSIMPDRNEEVTFALAAAITHGDIIVRNSQRSALAAFFEKFTQAGALYEGVDGNSTRYYAGGNMHATDVVTLPHPGFMTDWQAPWAVFMTQVKGTSTIHETVFESRFSYVQELAKMGARIEFFDPPVDKPEAYYNFNWSDRISGYHQGVRIHGPTKLHNAVLEIDDLRAGATLILAALVATGESYIHGVEQVDRGYEDIESRLKGIGAHIDRIKEDA